MCVVKSIRLNSDVIARATRMKLIMQYGVGLEGIDIVAATNHGIKVARIPSRKTGNAASCAEMAIYIMLGLLRKQVGSHINLLTNTLAIYIFMSVNTIGWLLIKFPVLHHNYCF